MHYQVEWAFFFFVSSLVHVRALHGMRMSLLVGDKNHCILFPQDRPFANPPGMILSDQLHVSPFRLLFHQPHP
jgi:hypothetical protein